MKKAITPVISVILLIMLVVAMTAGAWYWMTNVQSSLQESAGSSIEQTSSMSSTTFSIASVLCNATTDTVNVTIINTGSSAIASTTEYIMTVKNSNGATLGTDISCDKSSSSAVDPNNAIIVMGNYSSTSDSPIDLESGTTYTVVVNIGSSSQSSTVTCTN